MSLSSCPVDIGTMLLHDHCKRALTANSVIGHLVLRVDGGWIMTRYFDGGNGAVNIRESAFVAELDCPKLYTASNVFDMAVGDELTLGLTDETYYDVLVKAVEGGWAYYHKLTLKSGVQYRFAAFVPRAKRWATYTFIADGTGTLDTSITNLDTYLEPEVEVFVANGARRFLVDVIGTREDNFTVSGGVITWQTGFAPANNDEITLRLNEIVSQS